MRGTSALGAVAMACLLAAGCQPVKGLSDGGPNDGNDDAAVATDAGPGSPDATPMPPGRVTVRLLDDHGDPVPGATVVFNAANGAQLARTTTNGTGTASGDAIPAGSSVTVAASQSQDGDNQVRHALSTIIGVQPGDVLEIGPRTPSPQPEPMGALRLAITEEVAEASQYDVHIGCQQIGVSPAIGTTNIPLAANECNRGLEPVDLLLVAQTDGRILAFQDLRGVILDVPATANDWIKDFDAYTIKLSNVPDDAAAASLALGLFERALDYGFEQVDLPSVSASESPQHDFSVPKDFADFVQARVLIAFGSAAVDGFAMLSFTDRDDQGTADIDLATELPPRVQNVELQGAGADLTLQFTKTASTSAMDAGGAGLRWTDSTAVDGRVTWEWNIMLPPSAIGPIPLPRLPVDVVRDPTTSQDAWPPPTTATLIESVVGFLETTLIDGYGDFRTNRGFSLFDDALPSSETTDEGVARVTVGGTFADDFQP